MGAKKKQIKEDEPTANWYQIELPELVLPKKIVITADQKTVKAALLFDKAKLLFEKEVSKFESKNSLDHSDKAFLKTMLKSGTLNDKVSALTLLSNESPIHHFAYLKELVEMTKKKSKKEAILTIEAVKDLMIGKASAGSGLLPERKLKYFIDQPGIYMDQELSDQYLVLFYFEDALKKVFYDYIQILEVLTHDPLNFVKSRTITFISELLASRPEQEHNLLRLLVNKLGDGDRKISAKASYLLLQLINIQHPNMKLVVVKEIEQLLWKAGVNERAQYFAVITLNQIVLNSTQAVDTATANYLLKIYFAYFQKKMKSFQELQTQHRDKKRVHKKKLSKADEDANAEETKHIAAVLTGIHRAFPFVTVEDDVLSKHLDILFKLYHTAASFNTCVQVLSVLYHFVSSRQSVSDRFYRVLYESLLDSRLITTTKQTMYVNILYKALKDDSRLQRIKAFGKRIIQMASIQFSPMICTLLLLIFKIMTAHPTLKGLLFQAEEEDEEEHFEDAKEASESDEKNEVNELSDTVEETSASNEKRVNLLKNKKYDPLKREPLFSNAENTCFWELVPFINHYHPAIAINAATLCYSGTLISGTLDDSLSPLEKYSFVRFLDQFIHKQAKKPKGEEIKAKHRGSSVMQPFTLDVAHTSLAYFQSPQFLKKDLADIPVDEQFFYHFFSKQPLKKKTVVQGDNDEDGEMGEEGEDIESEIDEEEVRKTLLKSVGLDKVEEEDQEDDDFYKALDDMSDVDDDDNEDVQPGDSIAEEASFFDGEELHFDDKEEDEDEDEDEDKLFNFNSDDDDIPFDMEDDISDEEEGSEEEKDGGDKKQGKRKRGQSSILDGMKFDLDPSKTFASAEDFAHLLEQDDDVNDDFLNGDGRPLKKKAFSKPKLIKKNNTMKKSQKFAKRPKV